MAVTTPEACALPVECPEVGFLPFGQAFHVSFVFGVFEPVLKGGFAAMTEGGIADVVREAGGLYDFTDVFRTDGVRQFAAFFQKEAGHDAQRTACAGDFERVHLPVMDVVVAGEGWTCVFRARVRNELEKRIRS